MLGGVAAFDPVAVLEQRPAVGTDQDRAERLVIVLEGLARKLDTAAQTIEIVVAEGHMR